MIGVPASRRGRRCRQRALAALVAVLALGAVGLPGAAAATAVPVDEALYASLLERHTRAVRDTARVRVDYAAIARSEDWRRLVANLAQVDPDELATRPERLAFWINAYNVLAIDLVARHQPLESIRDIGSLFSPVWDREAGRIRGRAVTLGQIEHEILRPMGDPRIHAAIVCASVSCPPLRREPWTASRLDAQLEDTLRSWLADPEKGARVERADAEVHLSRIFDWFEEDFEPRGGVLAFVGAYLPADDRAWLERNASRIDLEYLPYDWNVNGL